MVDSFGREINYLRMSLTGRCQQKCAYCAREHGGKCIKDEELTADDFIFAADVLSKSGFNKIRLTGGEPLLRKDILHIVEGISSLGAYQDIALTTNGLELEKLCQPLRLAGMKRINLSLDTTNNDVYKKITGSDVRPVLSALYEAISTFDSVKINAVLIRGLNDRPYDLVEIARDHPVTVRFIELMPMGGRGEGIKEKEILGLFPFLKPAQKDDIHSPEKLYSADGFKGKIGFISPMSCSFCPYCNRLRLTWDGCLRSCLGDDKETDAREAIVSRNEEMLTSLVAYAVNAKPIQNRFIGGFVSERPMNQIGG